MRLSLKKAVLLWSVLALIGPVLSAPKICDDVERFSSPRAASSGVAITPSRDATAVDSDVGATPAPTQPRHADDINPTPGFCASVEQQRVFIRKNFVDVLGENIVEAWGLTGEQWRQLGDPHLAFDAPQKRNIINLIKTKLLKIPNKTDAVFTLQGQVSDVLGKMSAVHPDRLKAISKGYFLSQFPGATISFKDKIEGVQLGQRAMITTQTGEQILYHVKTHADGRLDRSSPCSAPKEVNPRELMVYKLLENLGVGCESHFFGRDEKEIYP